MTTFATTLFWVCAVIGLTGGFALFRGRSPADRGSPVRTGKMRPARETGKGSGCWFSGKTSAPVCAFCRREATGNLVFGDNAAVGMNATIGANRRTITFHYGSDHDGDVCLLRRDVVVAPRGRSLLALRRLRGDDVRGRASCQKDVLYYRKDLPLSV